MSSETSPQALTSKTALVLFSRCLESGHWPDKIQFTKYLYLLDYCHWRFFGRQLTPIRWIFYHYGPWSPDAALAMDIVQSHFRLGWRDLTAKQEDDREFTGFDAIQDKLAPAIEGMIQKIITAFKNRDVTDLIDWCYAQTEPMLNARRGDALDFSTVPVVKEMPVFYPKASIREMPQLGEVSRARIAAFSSRVASLKEKAQRWRTVMQTAEYVAGMQLLEEERTSELPDLHGRSIQLTDASVDALTELGNG